MPSWRDLYHVGLVVEDLDRTLDTMGKLLNYRWTAPFDVLVPVRFTDGREAKYRCKFVFTMQAPHIEYIQAIPGSSIWETTSGNAMNHLGYWTSDLAASCREFEAAGMSMEVCGLGPSGEPEGFAYYKTSEGLRFEIIDRSLIPVWDDFLHGRWQSSYGTQERLGLAVWDQAGWAGPPSCRATTLVEDIPKRSNLAHSAACAGSGSRY
jgi:hypothetical protein